MQTNSNLIPRCLIHSRRYQRELVVRQEQELVDARQEELRQNHIRQTFSPECLLFRARSISF